MIREILRGLQTRSTTTLTEPADWFVESLYGSRTYADRRVTTDTAFGIAPVYAAINLLSSSVGSLPMIVYRGEDRDRERAKDSPRWELLHNEPNPEQTADMFYQTIQSHLCGWGNAYIEKVKSNGGQVAELWTIAPSRVSIDFDSKGRKVFEIEGRPYSAEKIIHIPALATYNGIGLSPIQCARNTLATLDAKAEYQGRLYANDATPGGVLQAPENLSREAQERLKADWESKHGGMENRGKVAVLEDGVKWQPMGMPLTDQQWVEGEKQSATTIASIFQVPPSWIGGVTGDSLTYSTVEGEALHYVQFSLRHWLVRIEKGLKRDHDLFPDREEYPEFNVEGLLRGASAERASFYTAMNSIGAMTINDIRELENRPPLEGGDDIAKVNPEPLPVEQEAEPKEDMTREELLNAVHRIRPPEIINQVLPAEVRFEKDSIVTHVGSPQLNGDRASKPVEH